MSSNQGIPPTRTAIADSGGTASRPWYLYFQNIQTTLASQQAQIDALVPSGGGGGGMPITSNVIGQNSVVSQGVLANGIVTLTLVNDVATATPTSRYGTDSTGTKGWSTVASDFADSANVAHSAAPTTGIVSFDLTDVTLTGGGRLYGMAFDSKGRLAAQHTLTVQGTSANQVTVAGGDGSGATITLSLPQDIGTASSPSFAAVNLASDPATALQAATKQYVDNIALGLQWKAPALAATTANITLSGLQTIDGIALVAGNRCLVKNQTTPSQNGLYVVASGAWTRTTDMNTWAQVPNASVFVSEGTVNADFAFTCTADPGGTLGITPIPWVQFNGSTGGVTSFNTRTGAVTFLASDIPNTAVTPGTYGDATHVAQITVGADGRLTNATSVALAGGTQTINASENITAPAMVHIHTTGGTTTVRNASAVSSARPARGFILTSVLSGNPAAVYGPGQVITGFPAATLTGDNVYLATTSAGAPSNTPALASGNLLQRVGTPISDTAFIFDPDDGIVMP